MVATKTAPPWVISRAAHRTTLLDELTQHLGLSRNQAKRLLDTRSVFVNQRRVWMARHELRAGDRIEVLGAPQPPRPEAAPAAPAVAILREHTDWLVVNKPAGVTTNGPRSLEILLRQQRQEPTLEAVHRLDRDTTGCVLFSRNPGARPALVALFEEKVIRKTYLALVQGRFPTHIRKVEMALEGLEASTDFRLVEAGPRASLVEARPLTGRTHQIRLHARAVGFPLAGDRTYATGVVEDAALRMLPRQMLHSWKLEWPGNDGQDIRACAPWPADFKKAVTQLGLRGRSG